MTCSASSPPSGWPPARAQLHLRIGNSLAAGLARGEDVSLAELAGHFVQADPGSRQARNYSAAAARGGYRQAGL